MFVFILYKQDELDATISFVFSIPILTIAYLIGIKMGEKNYKKMLNSEYKITNDSIVQIKNNIIKREILFSQIADVNNKTEAVKKDIKDGYHKITKDIHKTVKKTEKNFKK